MAFDKGPFCLRTQIDHTKSGLVRYSDGHHNIIRAYNSRNGQVTPVSIEKICTLFILKKVGPQSLAVSQKFSTELDHFQSVSI
jgi:hypothetical protein